MKKLGMKKVWVPVIALCSVGLIVGTGYAAWTITERRNGTATGNRKADMVSTKHISVQNVQWYSGIGASKKALPKENPNPTVCFGWTDKGTDVSGNWLSNGAEEFKENREFTLAFEVKKDEGAGEVTPVVTRNVVDSDNSDFANCITKKLIIAPGSTLEAIKVEGAANENTTRYTVDVIFRWGDHFGNQNPMHFYNGFAKSADWTTYINQNEGYDASMYTDSFNSLDALAKLNTSSNRFDITIDVGGSN